MSRELTRTAQGDLIIPETLLGKLKGRAPETLRVGQLYEDVLVSGHAHPGERSRPLFYGDLRLFNVGEVMALISSMHKSGSLTLMVPHAKKMVFFASGQIVYAASNVEDDRLGEVLWRRGFLKLEQLNEVHGLVSPGKKLGAVLVERGMITPRQLYDGIREQVLEIVYSTFHFKKGEFLFVEGPVRQKGAVRLDLTAREVIMEGIRRVEEMTRLEELFPDREMVLIRRPVSVSSKLDPDHARVLELVDGRRKVEQILSECPMGELDILKILAKLRRVGMIDVREKAAEENREQGSLPEVLKAYSQGLRFIHQTLKAETPDYVRRLEAYLGRPSPQYREVFLGVGFDEDGQLDMDTLYRNARSLQPEQARKIALEALRAFFDYAQFQAMDVLDDEVCDMMMNRLQKIHGSVEGEN